MLKCPEHVLHPQKSYLRHYLEVMQQQTRTKCKSDIGLGFSITEAKKLDFLLLVKEVEKANGGMIFSGKAKGWLGE